MIKLRHLLFSHDFLKLRSGLHVSVKRTCVLLHEGTARFEPLLMSHAGLKGGTMITTHLRHICVGLFHLLPSIFLLSGHTENRLHFIHKDAGLFAIHTESVHFSMHERSGRHRFMARTHTRAILPITAVGAIIAMMPAGTRLIIPMRTAMPSETAQRNKAGR